jgi:hypothetical protein
VSGSGCGGRKVEVDEEIESGRQDLGLEVATVQAQTNCLPQKEKKAPALSLSISGLVVGYRAFLPGLTNLSLFIFSTLQPRDRFLEAKLKFNQ